MNAVSVVIPCYNRESTLERSLRSVFLQTVAPCEIIVVDDGSRDRSIEVARRYGSRVRTIEQPNAGAAAARNRGIEAAGGDWIAFLDSDDEWHPEKLALQLAAAERFPQAKLVFCDTLVRDESQVLMPSRFALGGLYGAEVQRDGDLALYDRGLFTRMLTQSRVITSAVMVRRELTELKFPEDLRVSEDWALWLSLGLRYSFASVDQILVTMHQQGDNLSAVKGKLYRNDVSVLERLQSSDELTLKELGELGDLIKRRRVGAIYHSLLNGETQEAKCLLRQVDINELGRMRYLLYKTASSLPSSWVQRLARVKLSIC